MLKRNERLKLLFLEQYIKWRKNLECHIFIIDQFGSPEKRSLFHDWRNSYYMPRLMGAVFRSHLIVDYKFTCMVCDEMNEDI